MKIQFRLKICDPRATLFYSTPRKDKAENGGVLNFVIKHLDFTTRFYHQIKSKMN